MRRHTKFAPPKDPLESEASVHELTPDDGQLDAAMEQYALQFARDPDLGVDQEIRNGVAAMILSQIRMKEFSSAVKQRFVAGFWRWLLGQCTDEEAARTPWGRQRLTDDPEVRAYIDMLVGKREAYRVKLQLLRMRVPQGLAQCYLYYKYITCGAEFPSNAEFLKEVQVWENAFRDADQPALNPTYMRHPRPYDRSPDDNPGGIDVPGQPLPPMRPPRVPVPAPQPPVEQPEAAQQPPAQPPAPTQEQQQAEEARRRQEQQQRDAQAAADAEARRQAAAQADAQRAAEEEARKQAAHAEEQARLQREREQREAAHQEDLRRQQELDNAKEAAHQEELRRQRERAAVEEVKAEPVVKPKPEPVVDVRPEPIRNDVLAPPAAPKESLPAPGAVDPAFQTGHEMIVAERERQEDEAARAKQAAEQRRRLRGSPLPEPSHEKEAGRDKMQIDYDDASSVLSDYQQIGLAEQAGKHHLRLPDAVTADNQPALVAYHLARQGDKDTPEVYDRALTISNAMDKRVASESHAIPIPTHLRDEHDLTHHAYRVLKQAAGDDPAKHEAVDKVFQKVYQPKGKEEETEQPEIPAPIPEPTGNQPREETQRVNNMRANAARARVKAAAKQAGADAPGPETEKKRAMEFTLHPSQKLYVPPPGKEWEGEKWKIHDANQTQNIKMLHALKRGHQADESNNQAGFHKARRMWASARGDQWENMDHAKHAALFHSAIETFRKHNFGTGSKKRRPAEEKD